MGLDVEAVVDNSKQCQPITLHVSNFDLLKWKYEWQVTLKVAKERDFYGLEDLSVTNKTKQTALLHR
jgi:hypothetical protein